jgi:tetratricopeptide (TPR) repeat protein
MVTTMAADFRAAIESKKSSSFADKKVGDIFGDIYRAYRSAIRHDPDWAEARTYFANFLRRGGKLMEALEHYRRATELSPNDAIVRFNFADALSEMGDIAGAIREAEMAVAIRPDFGEAYECLGHLATLSGDHYAALRHFDRALSCRRFHTTEGYF